jgi:hypothetical protein
MRWTNQTSDIDPPLAQRLTRVTLGWGSHKRTHVGKQITPLERHLATAAIVVYGTIVYFSYQAARLFPPLRRWVRATYHEDDTVHELWWGRRASSYEEAKVGVIMSPGNPLRRYGHWL